MMNLTAKYGECGVKVLSRFNEPCTGELTCTRCIADFMYGEWYNRLHGGQNIKHAIYTLEFDDIMKYTASASPKIPNGRMIPRVCEDIVPDLIARVIKHYEVEQVLIEGDYLIVGKYDINVLETAPVFYLDSVGRAEIHDSSC